MQKIFDKTYNVGSDLIRIKLTYELIYTSHELDMDVLDIGELEYGYEDEDNLTYYPNVFRLEFDDFERKNFYTLKFAFGETPAGNFEAKHSGEIFYNGTKIFSGYIDKETLQYTEETRTISFELVDYSIQLKQKSVGVSPQDWAGGIRDIILIYKSIYPGLSMTVTTDFDEYLEPTFNGTYFSHNWIFRGNGTIGVPEFNVDWASSTGWDHVNVFRQHLYEQSQNYAELLKAYSREFGLIIGTDGVNKVNITKRFIKPGSFSSENLTPNIIDYSTSIYLKNVKGVRNIPINNPDPPNNVIIEGSFPTVDGTTYGDPVDSDAVIDIKGILSRQQGTNNNGVANIRVTQGSNVQSVLNGIDDPDISPRTYRPIERIITRFTYLTRVRPKEKYELDLEGIDYKLYRYYQITMADIPSIVLRPIQISIDLINKRTKMQALEASL